MSAATAIALLASAATLTFVRSHAHTRTGGGKRRRGSSSAEYEPSTDSASDSAPAPHRIRQTAPLAEQKAVRRSTRAEASRANKRITRAIAASKPYLDVDRQPWLEIDHERAAQLEPAEFRRRLASEGDRLIDETHTHDGTSGQRRDQWASVRKPTYGQIRRDMDRKLKHGVTRRQHYRDVLQALAPDGTSREVPQTPLVHSLRMREEGRPRGARRADHIGALQRAENANS